MSDSPPVQPLSYSSLKGPVKFTRHETEVGVTFTSHAPPLAGAYVIAGFIGLALVWLTAILIHATRQQPNWHYALKPIMGTITCLTFLVLVIHICRILWVRRNVPVCVSIVGDKVITVLPTQNVMRQEIAAVDISKIVAKPVGRTLTVVKAADLVIHLRSEVRTRTILHAYPLGDVESIARELSERVAIIVSRALAT